LVDKGEGRDNVKKAARRGHCGGRRAQRGSLKSDSPRRGNGISRRLR